jgi:hypothetical protein
VPPGLEELVSDAANPSYCALGLLADDVAGAAGP